MYKVPKMNTTTLIINQSTEGETIEMKVRRIVNNKEPITDGAPIVYTERKDGVPPQNDIRTDRFEIAVEAHDKRSKSIIAQRESKGQTRDESQKITGSEPTQATTDTTE